MGHVSERYCDENFHTYRGLLNALRERSRGGLKERLCQKWCHTTGNRTPFGDEAGAGGCGQRRNAVDDQAPAGVDDCAEAGVGGHAQAGAGSEGWAGTGPRTEGTEVKARVESRFRTGAEGKASSGVGAWTRAGAGAGVGVRVRAQTGPGVCVGIGVGFVNGVARLRHQCVFLLARLCDGIGSLVCLGLRG